MYESTPFNRPFPSSKNSHFQHEAKCKTFVVKISFICMRIKTIFITMAPHFGLWQLGNGLLNDGNKIKSYIF